MPTTAIIPPICERNSVNTQAEADSGSCTLNKIRDGRWTISTSFPQLLASIQYCASVTLARREFVTWNKHHKPSRNHGRNPRKIQGLSHVFGAAKSS